MWEDSDPDHGSHFWITNPAADETGKMGLHTHGVRPFEQEVLGRDTLLFLFKILPDNPRPYALGYVPGGWRAVINDAASSGQIFLNYGSVLIAVTASQSFEWNLCGGILGSTRTSTTNLEATRNSELRQGRVPWRSKRPPRKISRALPPNFN